MKKLFLIILSLCFTVMLNAEVSRTVNITTPGTLSSSSIAGELAIVTNLTITGTIDARDFRTMRDDMPELAVIDISGVTIVAYFGTEGTYYSGYDYSYLENAVPNHAFWSPYTCFSKTSLTSVLFPTSLTTIGTQAFYGCTGLTSVTIPTSVTPIDYQAFEGCSGLTLVSFFSPSVVLNFLPVV